MSQKSDDLVVYAILVLAAVAASYLPHAASGKRPRMPGGHRKRTLVMRRLLARRSRYPERRVVSHRSPAQP